VAEETTAGATTQAVLGPLTTAAIFLVVSINPGAESTARGLLADLSGLQRAVGFRAIEAGLGCVVGVGSDAWDRLFEGPRPAELHPFREVVGQPHTAVSTSGDLLFHIRSARQDICFELATQIMNRLAGSVTVDDEVYGFRYFDLRDLLGFVDGTENPVGDDAMAAVSVGDEDPDFAGGSYVIVQKYLHDLDTWNAMPVEHQEKVVGRTKLSDIELDEDVMPSNSHVSLNTIVDDDGTERQIIRDNMPFGNAGRGEFGTYFIGYSSSPALTEQMLDNMFIGNPPGNYDRILDVSTAVTGGLFFVPTVAFLEDGPQPPTGATPADDGMPTASTRSETRSTNPIPDVTTDGSLRIGDLKRSTS
jgi:putative iron-dependent peroxidase